MMERAIVLFGLLVASASALVEVSYTPRRNFNKYVEGEYLVQFSADARAEFEHFKMTKASYVTTTFEIGEFMAFAGKLDATQLFDVQNTKGVQRIEHNSIFELQGQQDNVEAWGIDRVDQLVGMNRTYRWRDDADGSGVSVYVVDSGIDVHHPEFEGRARFLADCSTEQNPCITDRDTGDSIGHGTHCAGTVGSKTYGIAKNVNLVSVRVCLDSGGCPITSIVAGLEMVVNDSPTTKEPKIISMSIVGARSDILNQAVNATYYENVVVVVAAGNNNDNCVWYSPATSPVAITVAAGTRDDDKAWFSNWGICINVYAPGDEILSTNPNGQIGLRTGTSMATPHVGGAAALIASREGHWTAQSVRDTLLAEATPGAMKWELYLTPNFLLFTHPDGK